MKAASSNPELFLEGRGPEPPLPALFGIRAGLWREAGTPGNKKQKKDRCPSGAGAVEGLRWIRNRWSVVKEVTQREEDMGVMRGELRRPEPPMQLYPGFSKFKGLPPLHLPDP